MLVIGVVLLFIGAGVAIYGNYLNNDLSSQMEALYDGRLNPGDFALSLGWVILGAGALCILLLIVCKITEGMSERTPRQGNDMRYHYVNGNHWCSDCGTRLNPGDEFCCRCGAKQNFPRESKCLQCGAELEPGAAFCAKCGKERQSE